MVTVELRLSDEQLRALADAVAPLILERLPADDPWLTVEQYVALRGGTPASVRAKARRGTLKSRKVGRNVLVREGSVPSNEGLSPGTLGRTM
jgi:hypothetical protein